MINLEKTTQKEVKRSNDLRYSTTKIVGNKKIVVKIRLYDECKNGHQDFSITADIYEKAKNGRNVWVAGGCCHDEILKYFPQFKMFVDLHLSDYKGSPMYAVENRFYWIKEYKSGKKTADTPKSCLRISDEELSILSTCEDKYIFWYKLYELGIIERWESEAKKAIEYLESLTGSLFLMDSKKSNISELPEETRLMIKDRITNGYYSIENIQDRENAAIEDQKQKRIADLKNRANTDIKKINDDLSVHLHVVELGFPDDNLIYYNHTNTAVFNWQNSSYQSVITQEQLIDFLNKVDYSKLPEGITFELGK